MKLDKDVFTTFEAARICNANISSIKNWIDQGELEAFRTPGGHYRIEKKILDRFLKRYEMPNPFLDARKRRVLIVQTDREVWEQLRERLGDDHEYEFADESVDAVLKIGQLKPDVALIDARVEGLDILGLCRRIQEHEDLCHIKLVAVYGEEDEFGEEELIGAGAARGVVDRAGPMSMVAAIAEVLMF